MNIVGLKYPIKSIEDNTIVSYKTITKASHIENVAAFLIELDGNKNPVIILSYMAAAKLEKEQTQNVE